MINASLGLRVGFLVITSIAIVGVMWTLSVSKRTGGKSFLLEAGALVSWVLISGTLAKMEVLRFDSLPPTAPMLFLVGFALTLRLALSKRGSLIASSVPLAFLIGFQSFRILVELMIHRAYVEGIAPIQLTYDGLNFDIVTGISGGILGVMLLFRTLPRRMLIAWDIGGLVLLFAVVIVALLSAPSPLQVFYSEPPNTWILHWPWVWLPTVMVLTAFYFHVLAIRRLISESSLTVASE